MTVEASIHPSITDSATSKEMWDKLQQYYKPRTAARIAKLFRDLFNIKYQPNDEIMLPFVIRVKKIISINLIGYQLSDFLHAFTLVQQLPPEYESLVQQLYSLPDTDFTSKKVADTLINEANRQLAKDEDVNQIMKEGSQGARQRDAWIVDSASSDHYCNNKSMFKEFTPKKMNLSIAGEQSSLQVVGVGKVQLQFPYGNKLTNQCLLHPKLSKESIINQNGQIWFYI
ncbi:hypothetical protein CHUAL_004374 [Chamberlinius hualienensis]